VIVLTRQDVLAHQREVPWAELYQVEQDLLICLAMHAIFGDCFLAKEVAIATPETQSIRRMPTQLFVVFPADMRVSLSLTPCDGQVRGYLRCGPLDAVELEKDSGSATPW
jgi:hypothetical protein